MHWRFVTGECIPVQFFQLSGRNRPKEPPRRASASELAAPEQTQARLGIGNAYGGHWNGRTRPDHPPGRDAAIALAAPLRREVVDTRNRAGLQSADQ